MGWIGRKFTQEKERYGGLSGEMTRITRETMEVTCNCCGYTDNWIPETPDYIRWEWSEITQFTEGEDASIRMDLCPRCTREVKNWIRNGR